MQGAGQLQRLQSRVIEEAPFEEAPKRPTPQAKVVSVPRVRTSTAKGAGNVVPPRPPAKAAGSVVPPRPPLHIARAPPPKRTSAAPAPEAAAEPDLAANTVSEPTAWKVSLRAASALPRAATPDTPKARPAPRARSSSPAWEDRGDEIGFGDNRLDPEIAGAELDEVPPPQPEGLVRDAQGAAPGASDAEQAAQAGAKALGAQQPVTPPKSPPGGFACKEAARFPWSTASAYRQEGASFRSKTGL